jgi:hypothetical protein
MYQAKCRMQGRAKDMTELGVYSGGAFAPASCEKEDIAVRPSHRRKCGLKRYNGISSFKITAGWIFNRH